MSQFRPPRPTLISSGGGSGGGSGSVISNDTSSVSVVSGDTGDSINFTINEVVAIEIDESQNVQIGGTNNVGARLVVGDPNGNAVKLVNTTTGGSALISLNSDNGITFGSDGSNVKFGTNSVFLGIGALRIGTESVISTAAELNYTATTKGLAVSSKALVVDTNRDIANINNLGANTVAGTLTTGYQPNITSLNSIALNSITLNGTAITATAGELNYNRSAVLGSARASKTVVLDSNLNYTGLNRFQATTLAGTLETASQPNITEIGTLNELSVLNKIGIGTDSPTKSLEIVAASPTIRLSDGSNNAEILIDTNGNLKLMSSNDITISPNTDMVFNGSSNISGVVSLSAETISGTISTAYQPNITTIGSLSTLDVNGDVTIGTLTETSGSYRLTLNESNGQLLSINRSGTLGCTFTVNSFGDLLISPTRNLKILTGHDLTMSGDIIGVNDFSATTLSGTILTPEQPYITTIGTLSDLTVEGAISATSISANAITGTLQTASQPNITSLGSLINLSVLNTITTNALSATTLSGTLQTAAQLNITSIGTLSNLAVTNTITTNTVSATSLSGTIQTAAQPMITSIGSLTNLIVFNTITTNTLIAESLTGVIQTASQPNITSIGTLLSLSVTNSITAGSVLSTTLTGTLQTASQPNITSVGTLSSLAVTNDIVSGSLTANTIAGTLQTVSQQNITSVGTLTKLLTSGPIAIGAVEPVNAIEIDTSSINAEPVVSLTDGTMTASLSLTTSGLVIDTNGQYLTLADGVSLRFMGGSLIGLNSIVATDLTGTLQTASQPNITTVGTLDHLDSGYLGLGVEHSSLYRLAIYNETGKMITMSNDDISLVVSVVGGDYTLNTTNNRVALGNGVDLVLNEGTIIGLTNLEAINMSSETATYDADIAATSATEGGTLTVTGGASFSKNVIIGTSLTIGESTITGADIFALGAGTAGTVVNEAFLSTDEYGSLTGFNVLNATTLVSSNTQTNQIMLGNTTNNVIPMEIGYSAFTMTQSYAYNTNFNSHGVLTPGANPASYNYSIRALGRILCTQSVDVMSDKRTKTNIEDLTDDYCSTFIKNTTPVSFNWINGEDNKSFGYIAQDILRAGYPDLVNLVSDEDAKEIIDEDGFVSPAGIKFTVTYQHIIPILAKNQKRLMKENEELRAKIDTIMAMLESKS